MPAIQINPFESFNDLCGNPLSCGYIYIGEPNLDPKDHPIDVFYNDGLTQQAIQPLRTTGGYITNGCAPTNIYSASEDYSIRVLDKHGRLVFYFPSWLARLPVKSLDDSKVIVKQPFTSSVIRTQHDKNKEWVSPEDFGAKGDGATDDTVALNAWLSHLGSNGGIGWVNKGTYLISSVVLAAINQSFQVICSSSAEFVAATGFAPNNDMIQLATGAGVDCVVKWTGGRFNAVKQPNSASGESNDIFSVNATNLAACHIELDRTYSGADWLNSGSDSHLFIGGARNVTAIIHEAIGAVDAAIYISRSFSGLIGEGLYVRLNCYKCNTGAIVKRRFQNAEVVVNATDTRNGAATGTADIDGVAIADAGSNYVFRVNARRCEYALFLQAVKGVQAFVNTESMGVSISGHVTTVSNAVRLRGASNCQLFVNVNGKNPAMTSTALGALFSSIAVTSGTLQSTGNYLKINGNGLDSMFDEDASGSNNNIVDATNVLISDIPSIIGAGSSYSAQLLGGRVEIANASYRLRNDSGFTALTLNNSGSITVGPRENGVASTTYIDMYSSGGADRDARIVTTGGSVTPDSGDVEIKSGTFRAVKPRLKVATSDNPDNNSELAFELTSNTLLKVKVKGSDGIIRSASLTLA